MFEDLYTRQKTIEKQRSAPLLQERLSFLRHLDASGAKRKSLQRKATNLLRLVYLLDLKGPERVSDEQIKAAAEELVATGNAQGLHGSFACRLKLISSATQFDGCASWAGAKLPRDPRRTPMKPRLLAFAKWAREERGYAEATIESCCEAAGPILSVLGHQRYGAGRDSHHGH